MLKSLSLFLFPFALLLSGPVASAKTETIVIMGINDLHGTVLSQPFHAKDLDGKIVPYDRGGMTVLAAHIKILREEFGDRFFILEAGDEFTGSVESDLRQGAPLIQFWNSQGLTAGAIGNHEFDYGLDVLKKRVSEAKYPFLSANLKGLPWIHPSMMTTVGGLKIGVIGLTTFDTPNVSNKQATGKLVFSNLAKATVREAGKLRKQGARIIVVTVHAGEFCGNEDKAGLTPELRTPNQVQSECGKDGEIPRMLKAIPVGTIDAVVSGHTHTVVHQWISGLPVIQAGAHGFYYNLIYLTYDLGKHKVLKSLTRIEGPIPICSKVFSNQDDCDGSEPLPPGGRGNLVTPSFHGKQVRVDPKDEANVSGWIGEDIKKYQSVVGYAARPIERNRTESAMGDLIADILRERLKADVALMNPGGLRANLEKGPITYSDLFRVLPFENKAIRIKVSGKELREIITAADVGRHGVFAVSGLHVRLHGKAGGGHYSLDQVTLANGDAIRDDRDYQLATIDFLARGGDGLDSTLGKFPQSSWQDSGWGLLREVIAKALTDKSPLNTAAKPLLDPSHPRIEFIDAK